MEQTNPFEDFFRNLKTVRAKPIYIKYIWSS